MHMRYLVVILTLFLSINTLIAEDEKKPNVIVIVTDDQNYLGELGVEKDIMPNVYSKIYEKGQVFTKGYITTPNCCPSRSSILTGLYASNHGVLYNPVVLEKQTVPMILKENGYKTAIFGKYLNSWPGEKRTEFDKWFVNTNANGYVDPIFNNDGVWEKHIGYVSTILINQVNKFLEKESEKPFYILLAPNAPHLSPIPNALDEKKFTGLPIRNPPSLRAKVRGKPKWVRQAKSNFKPRRTKINDSIHLNQLRTLFSLDRELGKMFDKLKELKIDDNTIIFFISDNGYLLGEFGLDSKQAPYETAIHVPFAVKYPKLIKEQVIDESLVANIDIAPTIYNLTSTEPPYKMDGMSLTRLIDLSKPNKEWRKYLLIEGAWQPKKRRRIDQPPFYAAHSGDAIYIKTVKSGFREFYDLTVDPFQLKNYVRTPQFKDKVRELRAALAILRERHPAPPLNSRSRPIGLNIARFKKNNASQVQRVVEY